MNDLTKLEEARKDALGDKLCEYCSLEKKGVYSVNGGFVAGCEGSRCYDAYDNYVIVQIEGTQQP